MNGQRDGGQKRKNTAHANYHFRGFLQHHRGLSHCILTRVPAGAEAANSSKPKPDWTGWLAGMGISRSAISPQPYATSTQTAMPLSCLAQPVIEAQQHAGLLNSVARAAP